MTQRLIEIIIFSIPESIVILYLAFSILGEKINMLKMIEMGSVLGVAVYISRWITGSFILNIVISALMIIFLLKTLASIPVFEAAAGGLLAISSYLSIEFVNVKTWQIFSGVSPNLIEEDLLLKVVWFIPQILVMLGLQLLIGHFTRNKRTIKRKRSKEFRHEDQYL
ncbi:hypothetical protein [Dehalobacter sp. TBBPA1]|uniref:hypothetical protein n=1 Tax=Dehalobacter sp. TBBPA1 TaxID=3235037 RepID=UPI0034A2A77E